MWYEANDDLLKTAQLDQQLPFTIYLHHRSSKGSRRIHMIDQHRGSTLRSEICRCIAFLVAKSLHSSLVCPLNQSRQPKRCHKTWWFNCQPNPLFKPSPDNVAPERAEPEACCNAEAADAWLGIHAVGCGAARGTEPSTQARSVKAL